MFHWLSKKILGLRGWTLEGDVQRDLPKKMYVVVPHTHWRDFFLGLSLRSAYKFDVGFIGKKSLFVFPLGIIMRSLGGIPIDRSKGKNFIESTIEAFKGREKVSISIAPEGTRKQVKKLKAGFYHISRGANIPYILVKFDVGNKKFVFSEPIYPGPEKREEMDKVEDFFRGTVGFVKEYSFL